jgi:hypothetical protein
VDEVWVADDQSVRRLLPDGRLVDAHPETTAAASMVKALQVMDVDRDGADELVASVGEWSAYDLRWFKPRDGGLVLAGREKLGVGSSVVPWRGPDGVSLLIGRSESWPSARVFSAGNPEGWPPGIWVVALDGDGGLKRKHHIAMDGDTRWETARAADLDGDGVDEIVAQRGDVLVVHRLEAQRWNPRMLPGLTLIAVADVDGDQDDELLVRGADDDGGRWWLGVGDQTPPRLPPLVVSSGEAYRASDSLARETWARGSMLARVGLIGDAAAVFMDLAEVAVQADDRAAAARRAAELFAVHGDHDAAARAWHLLGEIDANVDARQREAEAWQASGRFDLELAARGAEGGARSADLAFLTGPAAAWSFNTPLDPRWKIERPLALRRDASQGALVVNATPGPLMWTDLVVSEPGFMLDVELEAGSLDWSAALSIGLVSEGFAAEVVVEQHGGGLLYERRVQARTPGGGALSVAVPDTGRLRFRWAQEGESTRYALTVWVDDAEIAHERGISALPPPRDARVRLEVRTLGVGPAATRAALRGIRVSGMATAGASDVAAEVEREQALWATIVEGRTPSAELDPVGALVIAARQGRIDDAWAALRRAPEDGERGRDAALRHLLRFEPVAWSTALWARDPADAPARLWAAFVGLAHERPDAPDARAAGLDALVGLEHRRVPAAAREPFLHLLRLRIDVSLAAGRLDLARAVLDRLLAELEAEPALRHDDDALLHAKVVARGGDAEAALHALVAGLATARCPTVFADRAMVSPELEPLRLLPGWSALSSVAAGRSDPR